MKRLALINLAALAFSTVAGPALGADLCVDVFVNSQRIVGKKFTVPARNTCKPFNGFLVPGFMFGSMAVGTGCTTPDGSLFRLHMTMHAADHNYFQSMACNFVLPKMTDGNCRFKRIACDFDFCQIENQGIVDYVSTATASPCSVSVP
jgi:hypothetical protein